MQLVLEKRAERSNTIALVSPLIAIGLTLVTMSILFAILGKNPIAALGVYFIDPLTDSYSLQEIAVKATPLVMIAIGLSFCYLANVWNIGAEGQFLIGAVAGSWLAVKTHGTDAGPWVLPAMLVLARRRRRALCPDPGDLQGPVRRQRNPHQPDAGLCRRSPARLSRARPLARPEGLQLPDHRRVRSGRDRAGADRGRPAASRRASLRWWSSPPARCCSASTIKGFEIRVVGAAPRAARFGGFNSNQLILLTFAISGALAGLGRDHRGRRAGRASAAGHLARLRLHRDHRRVPRPAESDWNINCRTFPRTHLHRRRAGADRNENPVGRHQGVPGHPAVLSCSPATRSFSTASGSFSRHRQVA